MCCGRPRQIPSAKPNPPGSLPPANDLFEYIGGTALTLVSPVTGRTYRFAAPGARVATDPRDRSWISFAPNLARRA